MPQEQEYLLKKVESIESRLENHVVKIELKLDQIVDIMKQVAALQEKETRNGSDIQELKGDFKIALGEFKEAILRVHERIDKNDDHHNTLETDFRDRVMQAEKTRDVICDDVKTQIRNTDAKVASWLNRGIGAWIIGSFMLIIIQGIGAWIVKASIDDFKNVKTQIVELQKSDKITEDKVNQLLIELKSKQK